MTNPAASPMRHVEACMGTVFSFDIRSPGVPLTALRGALEWLHHVDATYSTYRPDSVISQLRAGTITQAALSREVSDVLRRCEELNQQTHGYFSANATGALDPSGLVKGWAIEVASDLLEQGGSHNHCVNGGGDVQCIGEAAPGRPWRVGITDPFHRGQLLGTVDGDGRFAVATSGTAERGAHIVDPHTGAAANGLACVTVVGERLAEVDAWATAAFAMGAGAAAWLASLPISAAIVVHEDGRIWRREGADAIAPREVARL